MFSISSRTLHGCAAWLSCFFLLLPPFFAVSAAETAERHQALLEKVQALEEGDPVWEAAEEWAREGAQDRAWLLEAARSEDPKVALAAGYALLSIGEQREGSQALVALVRSEQAPWERRIDAAAALGVEGGEYASSRLRELMADRTLPERLQVEVAKSLWRLTRGQSAQDRLQELLQAKSPGTREEAALALAAMVPLGDAAKLLQGLVFKPGRIGESARNALRYQARAALTAGEFETVAPLLRQVAESPSLDPGSARLLLDVSHWDSIDPQATQDRFAAELVTEVLEKIHENYPVDESGTEGERRREKEKLESTHLATTAVKALARSLDPFCDYLDESDLTDINEQMDGEYGGIGAWVGMRNQRFTILLPMYNEPAYQAGLRAMDWIEKIDGKDLQDLTQNEIVQMLKGPPNTRVNLLVWRRGWTEPQNFLVTRKKINIPSVRGRMLPDRIAYIRIERFGSEDTTPVELEKVLRELEAEGMRALVLDLTNNPGGMLETAIRVADKFLSGQKLIVYQQGKPGAHDRKDYFSHGRGTHPDLPMAVLVNNATASASEIVAGALRDHRRAFLVGDRTFGKGLVQQLLWINATGHRTSLKITVAKYYLPNGDCIHKKGIEPDLPQEEAEIPMRSVEARIRLRNSQYLAEYLRGAFPRHEKTFRSLLAFDGEKADAYPDFQKLRETLKEKEIEIEPDDLRLELRSALMTHLASELGEDMLVDIQDHLPLQRAILELRKRLEEKETSVPLYAWAEEKLAARELERHNQEAAL
ncbi:MAG: S41 family peptidase [Planctomycetota bacterium]